MSKLLKILQVLALGSLGAGVFNLIGMTITARLLDPSVFGGFSVYASLVSILAVISAFRLDVLIFQKSQVHASSIFVLSFIVVSLTSALVFFIFHVFGLSGFFFGISSNGYMGSIVAFGVFCLGLYQAVSAFALKNKRYKEIAIVKSMQALLGSMAQVGLAFFMKFSLVPLVAGFVVSQAFGAKYLIRNFNYTISRRRFFEFYVILKNNYRFCSYSTASTFLLILSPMLPAIIISRYVGMSEAGLFYLAVQVTSIPFTFFRRLFSSVALAEGGAVDSLIFFEFLKVQKRRIIFLVFFLIISSAIYYSLAEYIFSFVFGPEWFGAGRLSAILVPMFFLDAVSYSCFQLLNINNKYFGLFVLELFRFIFVVGGVYLVAIYTASVFYVSIWYSASMAIFYFSIIVMLYFYFLNGISNGSAK